jgi:hypothetical protein
VIARTLDANRWNKNRTARILGISRRSLYNKLERYAITRPGAEPSPAPVAAPLGRNLPVELGHAVAPAFAPPAPRAREVGAVGT